MNANITKLYAITCNNTVVAIDTNLKALVDKFHEIEPDSLKYHSFVNKFKEHRDFVLTKGDKEYHFQQLIP